MERSVALASTPPLLVTPFFFNKVLRLVWFGLVFGGNGTSAASFSVHSELRNLAHASRDLLQVFRRSRDEQIAHIGWDRYGVLKGCSIHTGMSPSPVATDMPSERDLLRVTED